MKKNKITIRFTIALISSGGHTLAGWDVRSAHSSLPGVRRHPSIDHLAKEDELRATRHHKPSNSRANSHVTSPSPQPLPVKSPAMLLVTSVGPRRSVLP
ncbi:hypothetical protein E2C01_045804 [Portunus trituberculatus]|uniref:Uncharacterized protein n=1 Tax=Portunus trituberculatus TaxID=210409 RepID=A0A5B7G2D0_PORTR|nr:hypothetical protein [Portunus trituberculatus]